MKPDAEVHVVAAPRCTAVRPCISRRRAKGAIAAGLEPLITGMGTELRHATEERDALVDRERQNGLVGWVRC